ncbi:BMC domain-containing protein [Clostridium fallax]|uniref:Carboxysome shell and ethanolamine utilization microcompartment protein CcmL/EutN n=1 Tax=Clostridium fallax TaxID=1533 RepID=A0A1M4XAZ0_9CLOT|nr:BMC domain-containing protein [Clostridium fallax]SHE90708.1 Carboxysome shell and ethanolamine utilization microcompartment protein CcmL/EutN [Clostridium fallax]SQB05998.1 microcompartments protein [Clostridium fallax]
MNNALGLVEYLKIPTGMVALDKMCKTSDIKVVYAATLCPGKYVVLFKGTLASVKAALELSEKEFLSNTIDTMILGNPKEEIYNAISGTTSAKIEGALGIVESYSVASIVEASDIAAKSNEISLIELRLARGMCGKSFFTITGDLASVESAIEISSKYLKEKGMYLDSGVIANPDKDIKINFY